MTKKTRKKTREPSSKKTELSPKETELSYLNLIHQHPEGINFSTIVNLLGKPKSTVSEALNRLKQKKLINTKRIGKQKFYYINNSSGIPRYPVRKPNYEEDATFRGHKFAFKVKLVRRIPNLRSELLKEGFIDTKEKRFYRTNSLIRYTPEFSIEMTTASCIIHFYDIYYDNPHKALGYFTPRLEGILKYIEERIPKIRFNRNIMSLPLEHQAWGSSRRAVQANAYRMKLRSARLMNDNSFGPEYEAIKAAFAKDDIWQLYAFDHKIIDKWDEQLENTIVKTNETLLKITSSNSNVAVENSNSIKHLSEAVRDLNNNLVTVLQRLENIEGVTKNKLRMM